ncbi:ADP-ribosylglycohydrolase family protein [Virgibacillus salexigens]|nr:ADP-ribosylglycohydrolase family protein [Virgibacillus massiliensis]
MIDRWEDDNKSFLKLSVKQRIMPTIYGGIIGDLLGVPVEFRKRDSYCIKDVTGFGTYNQPPGTWSDDTSLTMCLIENLIEEGPKTDLMDKFVQYKRDGYWTPYGKMFDIGRTTDEAITRYEHGMTVEECGGRDEYENGNGAIMRIAPLVFVLYNEFNFMKKVEFIKSFTKLTHAHPRSIVGSIIFIEFLFRLYHNNTPQEALNVIKRLFDKNFDESHNYQQELNCYARLFDNEFFELDKVEINSDGYVVHTLEAAIWCLGNSTNFVEAVLKAVNLGDDTDTIAAITGNMAGMYYKMKEIPSEWLDKIARKRDIDKLVNNFYHYCADKAVLEEYGSN